MNQWGLRAWEHDFPFVPPETPSDMEQRVPWISLQVALLHYLNQRFGQNFDQLGPALSALQEDWPDLQEPSKRLG